MFGLINGLQDQGFFFMGQFMFRFRPFGQWPLILIRCGRVFPALQGSGGHANLRTGHELAGSCIDGFIYQLNDLGAICGAGQSSSSEVPQIASAFFLKTKSAAVSAKADSLRCSSFLTWRSSLWVALSCCMISAIRPGMSELAFWQFSCHWCICSGYKPFCRPYSDSSASLMLAVSITIRYLS